MQRAKVHLRLLAEACMPFVIRELTTMLRQVEEGAIELVHSILLPVFL